MSSPLNKTTTKDRVALVLVLVLMVVCFGFVANKASAWFGVGLTGTSDCPGVSTWVLTGDDEHPGTVPDGPFAGALGVNAVRTATTADSTLTVTVVRGDGNHTTQTVTAEAVPATDCEPVEPPPVVTPPVVKPPKPGKCETKTPCARDLDVAGPTKYRDHNRHDCGQVSATVTQQWTGKHWVLDHVEFNPFFDPRLCDAGEWIEEGY